MNDIHSIYHGILPVYKSFLINFTLRILLKFKSMLQLKSKGKDSCASELTVYLFLLFYCGLLNMHTCRCIDHRYAAQRNITKWRNPGPETEGHPETPLLPFPSLAPLLPKTNRHPDFWYHKLNFVFSEHYKTRYHTVCFPLCLAFFIEHYALRFKPIVTWTPQLIFNAVQCPLVG